MKIESDYVKVDDYYLPDLTIEPPPPEKSLDNGNITCIIRVLARRASHSIGNDGLDKAQAEMSATYPALLLFVQRNYNQRSERYCVYPAKYLNVIIWRRMRYGFSHK